jgi:hypothetical protein
MFEKSVPNGERPLSRKFVVWTPVTPSTWQTNPYPNEKTTIWGESDAYAFWHDSFIVIDKQGHARHGRKTNLAGAGISPYTSIEEIEP